MNPADDESRAVSTSALPEVTEDDQEVIEDDQEVIEDDQDEEQMKFLSTQIKDMVNSVFQKTSFDPPAESRDVPFYIGRLRQQLHSANFFPFKNLIRKLSANPRAEAHVPEWETTLHKVEEALTEPSSEDPEVLSIKELLQSFEDFAESEAVKSEATKVDPIVEMLREMLRAKDEGLSTREQDSHSADAQKHKAFVDDQIASAHTERVMRVIRVASACLGGYLMGRMRAYGANPP